MTLGAVSASDSSSAVSFCSCCGVKMVPDFTDEAVDSNNHLNQIISESFLTVKGAALFLPRGNSPTATTAPRISQRRNKHTGDLQKHLQTMFTVLRPEDTIRLAVRLESAYPQVTRYMVVVSTNGRQDTEESIVLGVDFVSDGCCTVGLVLPLWSDTLIHLDGDGGFSVSTVNRVHVFKPVSVQAMWSSLQSLHKACEVARCHNYYPGSLFLTWISYYQSRICSNQLCINEWNIMQDVESHRANSPVPFADLPTERERTERLIKMRLREIMMQKDLENVTCKEIRTELEMQMVCNLRDFKEFIDNEMIVILGQMDSPTEIFEHVYLGSEWNASNLEELQNSGVRYILNVTREIDNFFPGMFEYHNIRVYDEEATNLLEYWNDTYKFINKAKKAGAKCLVHCKMGVSRSASTVIAYAMKEYGWDLDTAFDYVKERRAVTKPNPSFMKQLEEYQGILLASKQRHNKLWRSHSDGDLSDRPEPMCKPLSPSVGNSDSHNNNSSSSSSAASSPSLHHFLGVAVLQALSAQPQLSAKSPSSHTNGTCDSPVQEEVRSDSEDPVLPRPRAATVVPEERLDNSASVAVTVPVAVPHPPPSLHILPPTPELHRAHWGPSTSELSLDLPERSSSEDVSPVTVGSEDSDLTNDRHGPLGPSNTSLPFTLSDDNNNPSELQIDGDDSSDHSNNSIDFVSAREKFLGLMFNGGRTDSEQNKTTTSNEDDGDTEPEEDETGTQSEDGVNKDPGPDPARHLHHDNGVSVRHIVTELEAISQPAPSLPVSPSSSSSSHSPQMDRPQHPEEVPPPELAPGSLTPPLHPPSPSTLPCDWPAGSVRRATEQLEQKLKQEMEMAPIQRSPLHSPGTEHPLVRPAPSSPSNEHPPLLIFTQGEITAGSESKDGEENAGSQHELQRLNRPPDPDISQVSGATPVTVLTSDSHTLTSSLTSTVQSQSSLNTSAPSHRQSRIIILPEPRSNQMNVDGATVDESFTDERLESRSPGTVRESCAPGCDAQSRLARGSQELERIQQTLRELQAFLHEGVGLEPDLDPDPDPGLEQPQGLRDAMDTESGSAKGSRSEWTPLGSEGQRLRKKREGRCFPETTGAWHRATELEARIRQAGLTPPSLMKRSASLAKLDRLELEANDLSDFDLRPHIRTTSTRCQDSSSTPPCYYDDTWKKQKVLTRNTKKTHAEKTPSSLDSSSSLSLRRCPKEEAGKREQPDGNVAPRQQGKGHSSRRSRKVSAEKKQRVVTVLYNTM